MLSREVEDARVASHDWPLDSAVVIVRVEAIWRSQSVLLLVLFWRLFCLPFLEYPGDGK